MLGKKVNPINIHRLHEEQEDMEEIRSMSNVEMDRGMEMSEGTRTSIKWED